MRSHSHSSRHLCYPAWSVGETTRPHAVEVKVKCISCKGVCRADFCNWCPCEDDVRPLPIRKVRMLRKVNPPSLQARNPGVRALGIDNDSRELS